MAELLLVLQSESRRSLGRQRYFRDRTDILDLYDDKRLIKDFRFPRSIILEIIKMCSCLERSSICKTALPVHIQVLTTLRFLARGCFQDDNKDIIGISQPSVSRVISDVSSVLCANAWFIQFPSEDKAQVNKEEFYRLHGMPNVIGIVDGTHIFIIAPSGSQEMLFVCRKGGHFINVQIVCDHNHKIIDIVVKWPGSTHDAFIWNNCWLQSKFERERPPGWLLGDSGYPCEPWLLTPYSSCPTTSHSKFNQAFTKTRSFVERTIGLWKSVVRRIDKSGGIMLYSPKKVCKVLASAVLHNIRRDLKLPEDEEFELPPEFFLESESESPRQPDNVAIIREANQKRD